MYQALGRQAKRNPDGTITVKVEIVDDRDSQRVRFETYTVAGLPELRQRVRDDLRQLAAAESDATLSAAIVNVLLAQV